MDNLDYIDENEIKPFGISMEQWEQMDMDNWDFCQGGTPTLCSVCNKMWLYQKDHQEKCHHCNKEKQND